VRRTALMRQQHRLIARDMALVAVEEAAGRGTKTTAIRSLETALQDLWEEGEAVAEQIQELEIPGEAEPEEMAS
jgi:hypothetical protein